MAHEKAYVYIGTDGTITIQLPLGVMPDAETIEKICEVINAHR